jgi:Skp family chaperone for outer membrane proteins
MSALTLRRSLVILATVASLFGGAVAIRAAAGWTASSAPLTAPPDPAALVAKLQDEKAHADAIAKELAQVVSKATELQDALTAAQEKAATDAESAADLAAQLAVAQKRLATLERQLAAQRSTTAGAAAAPAAATAAPAVEVETDDD